MADTIPNIVLPRGVWVNIYADAGVIAAGIVVGDQINVKNESSATIHMRSSAEAPTGTDYGRRTMQAWEYRENNVGDSGAWLISLTGDALINVEAV